MADNRKISLDPQLTQPRSGDRIPALDMSEPDATKNTWLDFDQIVTVYNVMNYGAGGRGVTDDGDAIQAAIDALDTAGGGVVYMPAGTYIFSQSIEILNRHNVVLAGAGRDVTILDCSATVDLPRRSYTGAQDDDGCISVVSDVNNTPVQNIVLRDFTLTISTDALVEAWQHGIFCGCSQQLTIERVKVDGGGPSSEVMFHQDDFGHVSTDWIVQDCEITNNTQVAINSNDTQLIGFRIERNWIHDGGIGMTMVGNRGGGYGIIADNVIQDCDGSHAIYITHEAGATTYIRENIVRNNIIYGFGSPGTHATGRYGIRAITTMAAPSIDAAILIQGNLIVEMYSNVGQVCRGIQADGNVTVKDNILRDVIDSDALNPIAIATSGDKSSGGGRAVIDGNRIEVCQANQEYGYGILVSNDADNAGTVITNNVIDSGALKATGYAFSDAGEYTILDANWFRHRFILGAVVYNGGNELDDIPISTPIGPSLNRSAPVTHAANYTMTLANTDCIASGAGTTITLPQNAPSGKQFTVKRVDAVNNIAVARTGADTIDGAAGWSLNTNYAFITCVSDGANYHIIATGGTVV